MNEDLNDADNFREGMKKHILDTRRLKQSVEESMRDQRDLLEYIRNKDDITCAAEESMDKRLKEGFERQFGKLVYVADTPKGLDDAIRLFKGYIKGENGFDELELKEYIIENYGKKADTDGEK